MTVASDQRCPLAAAPASAASTAAAAASAEHDPLRFRDVLGHYASGLTVIAGIDDDGPVGFTCQSFYSVSLEPPLVSFSVMATSTSYPRIRATERFAINVLSHDQDDLARQFARSGSDKWAGVRWAAAASGNPLIAGSLATVDCELWAEHEAGDHVIVVGRVVELEVAAQPTHPLLFYRGGFHRLGWDAQG